jgi:hypothetical protein
MSSGIFLLRKRRRSTLLLMAGKRVKREEPEAAMLPDPVTPLPKRSEDAPSPITDSVAFKVRDGKIDLSAMRQATRDRLVSAVESSLSDPEFRKLVGMGGEPPEAQVSKEIARMALDTYAAGEALVYANRLKIDVAKAHEFAQWGELEGELLSTQGAALANKYIPLAWRARLDLLFFFAMMFSLSMKKFQRASAYAHSIHPVEAQAAKEPEKTVEAAA